MARNASYLFVHEARKEGRTVAVIRGRAGKDGAVEVEAEIYPVTAPANAEPQRRPFTFASRGDADSFVEDALVALEYLGCAIAE